MFSIEKQDFLVYQITLQVRPSQEVIVPLRKYVLREVSLLMKKSDESEQIYPLPLPPIIIFWSKGCELKKSVMLEE